MGRAHEAEKRACAGVPGCERQYDEQEADTARICGQEKNGRDRGWLEIGLYLGSISC